MSYLISKPLIILELNNDLISLIIIFVMLLLLLTALNFYKVKSKTVTLIISISILFKIILLFIGYFDIFNLPHTGKDSLAFNREALKFFSGETTISEVNRGNYPIFLGAIYKLLLPSALLAQFFNLFISTIGIIFFYKILNILNVEDRAVNISVFLLSFFPHALIFSVVLLRESLISFLIIMSLYYFVLWYKRNRNTHFIFSVLFLICASIMHSGVIVLLIPYFFAFIFLKNGELLFSKTTILKFLITSIFFAISFIFFNELLFSKFNSFESSDELYETIGSEAGQSAYLTWINVDNFFQVLILLPLKTFYFLFSPLPFDWRGISDIISFLLDSSVYIIMVIITALSLRRLKKENFENKNLYIILICAFLLTISVFAFGTVNAGTALRHRFKVFPLLLLIYSMHYISASKIQKQLKK